MIAESLDEDVTLSFPWKDTDKSLNTLMKVLKPGSALNKTINLTVKASTAVGMLNTVNGISGLNAAKTVNVTGGNSLSSFSNGTTGVIAVNTAATTIDASAFQGKIALNAAASGLNSFLTIKGGDLTTDAVTMPVHTTAGTADKIASMTGVETLTLTGVSDTANNQVDLTNVTGLVTLAPSMSAGQSHISVKGLDEAVKIKVTSATTLDNVVLALTGATGAANSLDVEMTATGAVATHTLNLDVAGLETLNIASKDTDGTAVDLAGMVPTTGSTGTVNITGAGATTITAMDTGINVIDASAATGALTVAAAARDGDVYTITGGSANDSIAMENGADVLNGGSGTGDNLVVAFTAILGGINVDLSKTADVVVTMDGGTNLAAQSNFESVDVSAFSGFGAVVVGSAGANTIVGAALASNLSGAAGADIITIHPEATEDLKSSIQYIKKLNKKVGVSLNPETKINLITGLLNEIDLILIMSVNPGFGGQKFMPEVLEKIKELKKIKDQKNLEFDIEIDGGINFDNNKLAIDAGANILVSGTTVFKNNNGNIKKNIDLLKSS